MRATGCPSGMYRPANTTRATAPASTPCATRRTRWPRSRTAVVTSASKTGPTMPRKPFSLEDEAQPAAAPAATLHHHADRPVRRAHSQASTTESTMKKLAVGSSMPNRSKRTPEPLAGSGSTVSSPPASSPVQRPAARPTHTATSTPAPSVHSALTSRAAVTLPGLPTISWDRPNRYLASGGCSKLSGVATSMLGCATGGLTAPCTYFQPAPAYVGSSARITAVPSLYRFWNAAQPAITTQEATYSQDAAPGRPAAGPAPEGDRSRECRGSAPRAERSPSRCAGRILPCVREPVRPGSSPAAEAAARGMAASSPRPVATTAPLRRPAPRAGLRVFEVWSIQDPPKRRRAAQTVSTACFSRCGMPGFTPTGIRPDAARETGRSPQRGPPGRASALAREVRGGRRQTVSASRVLNRPSRSA
jgi:hypothetical protein